MTSGGRRAFLWLVLAQAAHSIEEYVFELYDEFGPTRVVSGLLSDDIPTGFALGNIIIVGLGLACYVVWVRPGRSGARTCARIWAIVECINGISHPAIALARGAYFPGAATAPLLLVLSLNLLRSLAGPDKNTGS
jgi:Protein of unknown function with HXXEE motif